MDIYTDSPAFAAQLFPADFVPVKGSGFKELDKGLFPSGGMSKAEISSHMFWEAGLVTEFSLSSQFDVVRALCRRDTVLPGCFFCLAGAGNNFHGQRKRAWEALPGNIHLTTFFRPEKKIADFFSLFPCLAAVSVLETIDKFLDEAGLAQIKWVNDIVLAGAKVAGFLAQSQIQEDTVKTAVLGIGVNVLATPHIKPDAFTPSVTSLAHFIPAPRPELLRDFLHGLLHRLQENYQHLLHSRGHRLLQIYQQRSLVQGQHVQIVSDHPDAEALELASGKVVKIGNELELYLENEPLPVRSGRLKIKK